MKTTLRVLLAQMYLLFSIASYACPQHENRPFSKDEANQVLSKLGMEIPWDMDIAESGDKTAPWIVFTISGLTSVDRALCKAETRAVRVGPDRKTVIHTEAGASVSLSGCSGAQPKSFVSIDGDVDIRSAVLLLRQLDDLRSCHRDTCPKNLMLTHESGETQKAFKMMSISELFNVSQQGKHNVAFTFQSSVLAPDMLGIEVSADAAGVLSARVYRANGPDIVPLTQ